MRMESLITSTRTRMMIAFPTSLRVLGMQTLIPFRTIPTLIGKHIHM